MMNSLCVSSGIWNSTGVNYTPPKHIGIMAASSHLVCLTALPLHCYNAIIIGFKDENCLSHHIITIWVLTPAFLTVLSYLFLKGHKSLWDNFVAPVWGRQRWLKVDLFYPDVSRPVVLLWLHANFSWKNLLKNPILWIRCSTDGW